MLDTCHSPDEEGELEEEAAVLLAALALTFDPDAFFHQHNAAVAQVRLLGFANPHPDPKHILFCHQHNAARAQVDSPSHLP